MIDEVKDFFEKHKTEIIVVAAGIAIVSGTILIAKKWGTITDNYPEALKQSATIKDGFIKSVKQPTIGLNNYQPQAVLQVKSTLSIPMVIQEAPLDAKGGDKIIEVSSHIRTLSLGRHASPVKVSTAMNNGFILNQAQTWVGAYSKAIA